MSDANHESAHPQRRWKAYVPEEMGDTAFTQPNEIHFTTEQLLRILAVNGFHTPVFEEEKYDFSGNPVFGDEDYNVIRFHRCRVLGPDGERYDAREVLSCIFEAERLERLCKDRRDPVMGLLRRRVG